MSTDQLFTLPPGLKGRFGVVKLWPEIKVAEDEVIARLKNAAQKLGLECVAVDHLGVRVDPPKIQMTQDDLDFVIHLHFTTPKSYDIFSLVALWNPLQFYHDFGYHTQTPNLLTHDDFLSCGSAQADDQVRRMLHLDSTRDGPHFTMYHSVAEPVLEPNLGDRKLFYAGINWERVGRGQTRHQSLLDELDATGKLRIFGPRTVFNVNVWEGYKSYQGSIPFDGKTMVEEIGRAGIALVLSSPAHVDAELMSNRLFEALAGGAVIICDQNAFAKRHFGDTLLYIDTNEPGDEVAAQIQNYIRWVEANPEEALALARRAQQIFKEKFRLDISLRQLYEGLTERRAQLARSSLPAQDASVRDESALPTVTTLHLLPSFDQKTLLRQIENIKNQSYAACRPVLVVDAFDLQHFKVPIDAAIAASGKKITIRAVDFFIRDSRAHPVATRKLGLVLHEIITDGTVQDDLFCVVSANERLFGNHVETLVGAALRNPQAGHAYADMMVQPDHSIRTPSHTADATCALQFDFSPLGVDDSTPIGTCRYLIRKSVVASLIDLMLPYLDVAAMAGFAVHSVGAPSRRATAVIDYMLPALPKPKKKKKPDDKDKDKSKDKDKDKSKDKEKGKEKDKEKSNDNDKDKDETPEKKTFEKLIAEEYNLVRDYDPEVFDRLDGQRRWKAMEKTIKEQGKALEERFEQSNKVKAEDLEVLMPVSLYMDKLSKQNRRILVVQLIHAIIPRFVWSFLRAVTLRSGSDSLAVDNHASQPGKKKQASEDKAIVDDY